MSRLNYTHGIDFGFKNLHQTTKKSLPKIVTFLVLFSNFLCMQNFNHYECTKQILGPFKVTWLGKPHQGNHNFSTLFMHLLFLNKQGNHLHLSWLIFFIFSKFIKLIASSLHFGHHNFCTFFMVPLVELIETVTKWGVNFWPCLHFSFDLVGIPSILILSVKNRGSGFFP